MKELKSKDERVLILSFHIHSSFKNMESWRERREKRGKKLGFPTNAYLILFVQQFQTILKIESNFICENIFTSGFGGYKWDWWIAGSEITLYFSIFIVDPHCKWDWWIAGSEITLYFSIFIVDPHGLLWF